MKGEFMGFRAVIFDMDGVLIDSEYLYLTGIHRELQKKRPWVREESPLTIWNSTGSWKKFTVSLTTCVTGIFCTRRCQMC